MIKLGTKFDNVVFQNIFSNFMDIIPFFQVIIGASAPVKK